MTSQASSTNYVVNNITGEEYRSLSSEMTCSGTPQQQIANANLLDTITQILLPNPT